MQERRYKILKMSSRLLVSFFRHWRNPVSYLCLPVTDDLPPDTEVIDVQADWAGNAIHAHIYHPSFDVVPAGEIPPSVPGILHDIRTVPFQAHVEAVGKSDVNQIDPTGCGPA